MTGLLNKVALPQGLGFVVHLTCSHMYSLSVPTEFTTSVERGQLTTPNKPSILSQHPKKPENSREMTYA
jgi:hypothetical protein